MRRVCLVILAAVFFLPAGAQAATPKWLKTALSELPQLSVKAAAPMTGYSRAKFGPAWEVVM